LQGLEVVKHKNSYKESFNGRLGDEFKMELSNNLMEAKVIDHSWHRHFTTVYRHDQKDTCCRRRSPIF